MIRVLTWNVARRSSRLVDQATVLAEREPDVVALQEVTSKTIPLWSSAFKLMGLTNVRASAGPTQARRASGGRTFVMLASSFKLGDCETRLEVPRPESALSQLVHTTPGRLEVHCLHVPNAANGWVKVETLQALRRGFDTPRNAPRVLCGDLNTPRRELADGTTISFARDSRGRLRPERGPEWDAAELGVVPGLRDIGYHDAYRTLHGYSARSPSWTWKQIAGHDGGWRLDHTFVSGELDVLACQYHHDWRERGFSDHSALETDLEFGVATGTGSSRRAA